MRTHFCFEISAVSATSYEGASEHTDNRRRRRVAPKVDHVVVQTHSHVITTTTYHGTAARWTRGFCVILPVHILLVLDYPTEHLGTSSRLGQELVSCQSGTRLVRVHMVL